MTAPLGGRAGATTTLPRAYGEEGILAFDKEKQQLFTLVDSCVHNWQAQANIALVRGQGAAGQAYRIYVHVKKNIAAASLYCRR
jgi:hypothetical protein